MYLVRKTSASLMVAVMVGLVAGSFNVHAGEYVWARSNWGNGGGPNRPVGVMGNGYGGYYVPRNAYGNNYAGQRITNPNGFIVPAQPMYQPTPSHRMRRR